MRVADRIVEQTLQRVREQGIDPVTEIAEVRAIAETVVSDFANTHTAELAGQVPTEIVREVTDLVAGLGPLQQYLDDPTVEEIWINAPNRVFVARDGKSELTPTVLRATQVRDLVERMLSTSGRRLDMSSPFVDAALADGSRLHVAIPDVA